MSASIFTCIICAYNEASALATYSALSKHTAAQRGDRRRRRLDRQYCRHRAFLSVRATHFLCREPRQEPSIRRSSQSGEERLHHVSRCRSEAFNGSSPDEGQLKRSIGNPDVQGKVSWCWVSMACSECDGEFSHGRGHQRYYARHTRYGTFCALLLHAGL